MKMDKPPTIAAATTVTSTATTNHRIFPINMCLRQIHQPTTTTQSSETLPPLQLIQTVHQLIPPTTHAGAMHHNTAQHCILQTLPSGPTLEHVIPTTQTSHCMHLASNQPQNSSGDGAAAAAAAAHSSLHNALAPITGATHCQILPSITSSVSQYLAQMSRSVGVPTSNGLANTPQSDSSILYFHGGLVETVSTSQQQPQQYQKGQTESEKQQDIATTTTEMASISNLLEEKTLIYCHPLFPLLRVLFEKCEVATNSIDAQLVRGVDSEVNEFITDMAKENKPFFTADAEVDGLMLKSLQVLRIHMLELEKVNELCKDFCTRYISCLRGKLNSENIMKTLEINTTPPASPTHQTLNASSQDTSGGLSSSSLPSSSSVSENSAHATSLLNTMDTMDSTASMVTAATCASESTSMCVDSIIESVNGIPITELTSGFLSKKNKCGKRGVLPKQATNVMKQWLFQHLVHPYPSEEEKKQLAEVTNLSNLQVNNWFINARRRILQPMLETTTTFLKNNKKAKLQRGVTSHGNWTNSNGVGIYNHRAGDNLQHQSIAAAAPSVAIVVSPTMVSPQSSAVILNLTDGQTQPVILTQPLQFVQVTQIQSVAGSSLSASHSGIGVSRTSPSRSGTSSQTNAQVTTISTSQASIVVPLLHEKMTNDSLVASLTES